VLDQQQEV